MGDALTKLGINLPSLIAQGINFGILFAVLWFLLYKPILKVLKARTERIEESIKSAEKVEKELAKCEETKTMLHARAAEEAKQIIEDARLNAKEINKDADLQAKTRAETIMQSAAVEGTRVKAQIIDEAKDDIAKLVEESLTSLLKKDTERFDDVLINEALAGFAKEK